MFELYTTIRKPAIKCQPDWILTDLAQPAPSAQLVHCQEKG